MKSTRFLDKRKARGVAVLLASGLLLSGCQGAGRDLNGTMPGNPVALGDANFVQPIQGLSEASLASYQRGRLLYDRTFTPADGLGPLFNNTSCKICHGFPNSGGSSGELLTLIGGESDGDAPRTLKEKGGPVISDKGVIGIPLEAFPMETLAISKRMSPPTYGNGLIEAIAASDITAQMAANPAKKALGIRGRANWDINQIGRFGWKAQTGDMISFTVTAANFEMGLSSALRPYEFFPNLPPQFVATPSLYASVSFITSYFNARGAASTSVDLTNDQVNDLTNFQRFQAPPAALPQTDQIRKGKELFTKTGCAYCHTPQFVTASNSIGVPEALTVGLYSDLLLHDMGSNLSDGITWQGDAKPQDWRTTPLWGLRYKRRMMHDGRTDSVEEAIQLHGGEGEKVTEAYHALSQESRDALKAFLLSL